MSKELHRGKLASNPQIYSVAPLTRDDLACLKNEKRVQPFAKTFRDSHHRLARLVASGLRDREVCLRGGSSASRLAVFKSDPAFQELVSAYREKVNEAFVEEIGGFFEIATENMMKAEVMLSDKIDAALEEGTFLPTKDLLAISRDGADRFGFPKQKQNQNTNVNVDFAYMLEKAAARSGRSNVIDASPVSRGAGNPQPPSLPAPQPKPSASVAGIRRRA